MLPAVAFALLSHTSNDIYFHAPAGQEYASIVPGGRTVLDDGKILTPVGRRLYGADNCWNVELSSDGTRIALFDEQGFTVYSNLNGGKVAGLKAKRKEHAYCGKWIDHDRQIVTSGGDDGTVVISDALTGATVKTISLDKATDKSAGPSYVNDIVLAADGRTAYCVDLAHQELVTVDLWAGKVVGREPAGRQPYAVAQDPSSKRLYVANIGVFDYASVGNFKDENGFMTRGLTKPPFAFPSPEAETGTKFEGRDVPGLGSPYTPDGHSVWSYRLVNGLPKKDRQANTGLLIHSPSDQGKAVGASAPCAVITSPGGFWVANSNNDTVQEFDGASLRPKATVKLAPCPELAKLRGVIPSAMALDSKSGTLYIACSGLNAVAVVDVRRYVVKGYFPTGWFPVALKLSPSGKTLVVACQHGYGEGPRGAKSARKPGDERYGLSEVPGFAEVVDLAHDVPDLASATRRVLVNDGLVNDFARARTEIPPSPIPLGPGKPSDQIKYVVFITKENHSFDGIFGGLKGARTEPDYAEFGKQGWARELGKKQRMPIMPNHIDLAQQFSISDNFYMQPGASGNGHRWLVGVYGSLWTERVYFTGWGYANNERAKGRMASFGSNGSQLPEDYLENGSMWEHFEQAGISYRNYGEGFEFPGCGEDMDAPRPGAWEVANYPIEKSLWDHTCWNFPIFNTNIPDIARTEWFEQDLEQNYIKLGKDIPQFMNITLCNDHGTSPRPKDGYPYVCSYMADNDLALGQLVEYLSHLPQWTQMAVFVTQDDPGGDDDSVDGHRSYVLALGPWAKKGYVSHDHTTIMSILKTIYLVFGLGPNNLQDGLATDLRDMFTLTPDFSPYRHEDSDPRVFVPLAAYNPSDPAWKAKKHFMQPSVRMDDPKFIEWMRSRKTVGDSDGDK